MQYRGFLEDRSGNFAIFASVAVLALLACSGFAVDYYTLTNDQKTLQSAADAAVLAVAGAGSTLSDAQAEKLAQSYLSANFAGDISGMTLTRVGMKTTLNVSAKTPLAFGGLLGQPTREVGALASADVALASYEIGLAFDTTGSMAGPKLAALKDAAIGMIDDMAAQNTVPGNLKFALVPFSTFVNVGPQFGPTFNKGNGKQNNDGAPWLDLLGEADMPQTDLVPGISRFQLFNHLGYSWAGCVETRDPVGTTAFDTADIPPSKSDVDSLFVPAFDIDEPDDPSKFPNSYIMSNAAVFDFTIPGLTKKLNKYGIPVNSSGKPIAFGTWTVPALDAHTSNFYSNYHPDTGPNFSCSAQPLTPLTGDVVALKKAVNSLSAAGSTNILEGVMWGWRVLSSREPFTEGRAEGKSGNHKILVLMTDGQNSFGNLPNDLGSGYSSYGYLADERIGPDTLSAAGTTSALDAKTLAACSNAKQDGVEIYTILLEVNSASTSKLLQDCASAPDHFFNLPNRSMLKDAFSRIKDTMTLLRLSG